MLPPFAVKVDRRGSAVSIAVSGELDMYTAPRVQRAIDELELERLDHLVFDLSELDFMGSSGIALVIKLAADAREAGTTAVFVRGTPVVQRVFEIAGIAEEIAFVDRSGTHPGAVD